jgi:hypothetical protein
MDGLAQIPISLLCKLTKPQDMLKVIFLCYDAAGWRKLYSEELYSYNLYSSPDISMVITSGRMRRTARVARMENTRYA